MCREKADAVRASDSRGDRELRFQRLARWGAAREFVASLIVKISTKGDRAGARTRSCTSGSRREKEAEPV